MRNEDERRVVRCTECDYAVDVTEDSDELPADFIIEHGRETGHNVVLATPESDGTGDEAGNRDGDDDEADASSGDRDGNE